MARAIANRTSMFIGERARSRSEYREISDVDCLAKANERTRWILPTIRKPVNYSAGRMPCPSKREDALKCSIREFAKQPCLLAADDKCRRRARRAQHKLAAFDVGSSVTRRNSQLAFHIPSAWTN